MEAPALSVARFFEAERQSFIVARRLASGVAGDEPLPPAPALASPPNLISLTGYGAGIAWLAGAHPAFAVYSILADELDGVSARNLGVASPVGDRLDWGIDVCMLALVGVRIGMGWVSLPLVLLGQVLLKERGFAPPFGSTRAALIGYALTT